MHEMEARRPSGRLLTTAGHENQDPAVGLEESSVWTWVSVQQEDISPGEDPQSAFHFF